MVGWLQLAALGGAQGQPAVTNYLSGGSRALHAPPYETEQVDRRDRQARRADKARQRTGLQATTEFVALPGLSNIGLLIGAPAGFAARGTRPEKNLSLIFGLD